MTDAENAAGVARADSLASGFGITTMFSARTDEGHLRALAAADRAGTLTTRVVAALEVPGAGGDTLLARLRDWRARYATPHVLPTAAKLFQDGVIESGTAALLAPYLGRGTSRPARRSGTRPRSTGCRSHSTATGSRSTCTPSATARSG